MTFEERGKFVRLQGGVGESSEDEALERFREGLRVEGVGGD